MNSVTELSVTAFLAWHDASKLPINLSEEIDEYAP